MADPRTYFSKEETDKLLEISSTESVDSSVVSLVGAGAGAWSRYRSYMQNKKNAILRMQAALAQHGKQKIILCDSLVEAPGREDLALLSALTEHYEVYPWTGSIS